MFNFTSNQHLLEGYRYIVYVISVVLLIILAATFNFFIREQETQAKEKEFKRQIEQTKHFLNIQ